MEPRKGWFVIPGVQDGATTLEKQWLGLEHLAPEVNGKTVCDFGCAEGLIALELARLGARSVYACDNNGDAIEVAKSLNTAPKIVHFHQKDMNLLAEEEMAGEVWPYDIVLALAVLHKLHDPEKGLRFAAAACSSLLVLRLPNYPETRKGILRGKHMKSAQCNVAAVLSDCGFVLERTVPGPNDEPTQYWRRGGVR